MNDSSVARWFPRSAQLPSAVPGLRARTLVALAAGATIFAVTVIVALLFTAPRAPLTSDESLYISEALNIARGLGPRYTTHEFIQHRPFLFPALLAIPLRITGDFTSVYWVTKTIVVLNAFAVSALAWRLRGRGAAVFTAALVLPNAFLNSMGISAYLDGAETLFLLLSLLLVWHGFERRSARWWAAGGVALGCAFLTKEAAMLWLPLPVAFAMLTCGPGDARWPVRGVAAWLLAFVAVAGWWWPYVFAVDGRVYMWPGTPLSAAVAVAAAAAAVSVAALLFVLLERRHPAAAHHMLRASGLALTFGWVAAFIFTMETTSWPYPKDFVATIPHYFRTVVAGNVVPWPLAACAALWTFARAPRQPATRLLALGLLLWLPFATFAANRNFALRDLLPMIYLVYAAAGILLADVSAWLRREAGSTMAPIAIGVIVLALIANGVAGQRTFFDNSHGPLDASDWNNPLVQRTAAWLDAHVTPDTPVMSSRLYFSQFYVLTGAKFPVSQLPTVNVVPRPDEQPYLQPRSTLFRWEDAELGPPRADERWLTVDEFEGKRYFTALSETDLLDELRQRDIGYLVVTGEDAAFSSLRYLDYFSDNPAFSLVHEDQTDAASVFIFRVDRSRLAPRDYPTVVPATVLNHLYGQYGGGMSAGQFVRAINPWGVVVRPSSGLAPALTTVTIAGD
jgi:4-amino-4-deoxy-L-arabinose transferase-like glycosyltransferase